ncbi:adhesin [Yersinia enterocolitica]|uniref:inverse autotransporter beta domain-containing protein n=1 Tax=Yersinia enterocolitica TaxID=630 RepID=UPI00066D95FA|nr:inverse autotransporter beta domain-containing protein [Yersinia enterocolitica]AOF16999.1 adhesin [Yersinia enterocolitica]AOF21181.1 adhesin [Yersinia enterocolitica]AOF25366.1 adhesin [Yersinia enterocolitica]AOF29359.1 adhesin [Yersinia enterocolitica]AOF33532.1 adhesin [Yersinia enterocolitica]
MAAETTAASGEPQRSASQAEQSTADAATRLASILADGDSTKQASSIARGTAAGAGAGNEALQKWFNQFGSAKVQLNLDEKLSLKGSQLDVLLPLTDSPDLLTFTQLGGRYIDDRVTLNFGLGQRHFFAQQMLGYNLFVDHDASYSHTRIGVGAEYGRDFINLAANGYFGVSGWKNSPDLDKYDEKVANGFDLRSEAYLPTLPQLGGKLIYEQYFGDEVGLFGVDNRQKNPLAVTVGVNYTPIPLVTVGVDHKMGRAGMNDTRFNLGFNYIFGTPLAHQLDSEAVAIKRSLIGSRYNLVDRNNQIVMKYRKQNLVTLELPARVSGAARQTMPLVANATAQQGIDRIEWEASTLTLAGGKMTGSGNNWQITLPSYLPGGEGNNTYRISAIAYDTQGNASPVAYSDIVVDSYGVNTTASGLTASPESMPANATASSVIELNIKDNNNQPITGIVDELTLSLELVELPDSKRARVARAAPLPNVEHSITQISESAPGVYQATLTAGSKPQLVNISAQINGVPLSDVKTKVAMLADESTATIQDSSLQIVTTGSIADNATANQVKAVVVDAYGNKLSGVAVNFTVDANANIVATTISDKQGVATATITSSKANSYTVKAELNGETQQVDVNFIADAATAVITADNFTVEVNEQTAGSGTNRVQAIVLDKQGNPVPNMIVTFTATNGVTVKTASVQTGIDGKAATDLTMANVGGTISSVTAAMTNTAGVSSSHNKEVTFYPDFSKATLNTPVNTYSGFSVSSGFPTTGFKNANFQLAPHGNVASNSDYEWASSDTNISVSSSGLVNLDNDTTGTVTITATWKQDKSKVFTYQFTLNAWVGDYNSTTVSWAVANSTCVAQGLRLPNENELSTGGTARGIGTFFGEWGNLNRYPDFPSASIIWTSTSGNDFHPDTGISHAGGNSSLAYMCVR